MNTIRRSLLITLALSPMLARAAGTRIEVWKTPTCGCCNDWIDYLRANGFDVVATDVHSTQSVRARFGLPARYGSCHTAVVGGYVVEGHVPVREIRRMLREKPKAVGIAVPDMPVGSPGMDGRQYKGHQDPYDVLLVFKDGSARIFQSY